MRALFSRNFAYAKFRDDKVLVKISEFTVIVCLFELMLYVPVNIFSVMLRHIPGLNQNKAVIGRFEFGF